ncbi:MAG: hypothetical protein JXR83_05855 [Deltaproteobacteria bacterium]|nr:hypothetical protein [Deltaproteobacteria bacterium]
MDRSRYLVLGLLVLFIGAAIWLGRCDDARRRAALRADGGPVGKPVVYPRQQRSHSRRHVTRTPPEPPAAGGIPRRSSDPVRALERAALANDGGGAIFVEVNAIRHSPIVEKMLRCRGAEALEGMAEMKQQLGIDPLEDLDRIAVSDQVFAVSGLFDELKLPAELGVPNRVADGADLFRVAEPAGSGPTAAEPVHYLALVDNSLLISGDDEQQVRAAIDRAQGRAAAQPLRIEGSEGEIYGKVGREFIGALFAGARDPMAQRLREVVQGGLVRMTVDEQVALSLDVEAIDRQTADDLARAVAGAFAALRTEAARSGRDDVADLLEQARVDPRADGTFALDVAVPGDMLLRGMGCDSEGRPLDQRSGLPSSSTASSSNQ